MKLNKILLTIPALGSVVLPLSGCACNKGSSDPITITIEDSEKIKTTEKEIHFLYFNLKASQNVSHATFEIKNIYGVTPEAYLRYDGTTNLQLVIQFPDTAVGGEYTKFDIDIKVDEDTSSLTGLKGIYMAEHNIIPESVLTIEGTTLYGLDEGFDSTYYDTISIPSTVTTIAEGAFESEFTTINRSSIKTLVLNQSLTTIKNDAFKGCTAIELLDISELVSANTIPTIGSDAFTNWKDSGTIEYGIEDTYLNTIDYPLCDGGLPIGWFDTTVTRNVLESDLTGIGDAIKANWTYDNMPKHITTLCNTLDLTSYTGCSAVAENAFYDPINDVSLIPDNIVTLGLPKNIQWIRPYAFYGCPCSQFIDPTTGEVGDYLVIPSTVKQIKNYALSNLENLYYIELNEGLTDILQGAFSTNKLYGIYLPSTVTTIEKEAFANSTNLISIDVTAITSSYVPSAWSTDRTTFNGMPEQGWISCKPANAEMWTTYFSNFVTIQDECWQITDDYDILKEYKPIVTPHTSGIYESLAAIMRFYKEDFADNLLIVFDDMIWTVQNHLNKSDFNMFNLKVNNISYDEINDTLTFMLSYRVKFKNDNTLYRGYMLFVNMYMGDVKSYTCEAEATYANIEFGDVFKKTAAAVTIKEWDEDGYSFTNNFDASTQFTTLGEANLGKILNKLQLFKLDSNNELMFEERSYYLKGCRDHL